jgi:hypothetical protein
MRRVTMPEQESIASCGSLELAYPACSRGIGFVITAPSSANLIEGVGIAPIELWPDDRGYFLEVQRMGRGLAAHFPPDSTQISTAFNYLKTIKAFHYHLHQTDCWMPVMGMLQIALVDSAALATSHSTGYRACLQGDRWRTGHADLCDRSVL